MTLDTNQLINNVVTIVVPTSCLCYLILRLTIKAALADFIKEVRAEFVQVKVCNELHKSAERQNETLDRKVEAIAYQMGELNDKAFVLMGKREGYLS